MANEQDKTKVLYDAVSKDYNIGTFDEFKSKLQDENKRKAFYNGVGKEYNLGTYDEFSSKVSPVKKKEPAQPSTGSLGFSQYLQEKPTSTQIPFRQGAEVDQPKLKVNRVNVINRADAGEVNPDLNELADLNQRLIKGGVFTPGEIERKELDKGDIDDFTLRTRVVRDLREKSIQKSKQLEVGAKKLQQQGQALIQQYEQAPSPELKSQIEQLDKDYQLTVNEYNKERFKQDHYEKRLVQTSDSIKRLANEQLPDDFFSGFYKGLKGNVGSWSEAIDLAKKSKKEQIEYAKTKALQAPTKETSFSAQAGEMIGGVAPDVGAVIGFSLAGLPAAGAIAVSVRQGAQQAADDFVRAFNQAKEQGIETGELDRNGRPILREATDDEAYDIATKAAGVGFGTGALEGLAGSVTGGLGGKLAGRATTTVGRVLTERAVDVGLDAGIAGTMQTGRNLFDRAQGLQTSVGEGVLQNMAGEVLLSAPVNVVAGRKEIAKAKKASEEAKSQLFEHIFNAKDNPEELKKLTENLEIIKNQGLVTESEYNDIVKKAQQYEQALPTIPEEIKNKKAAADLIIERNDLAEKAQTVDEAYKKPIEERIKQINEELLKVDEKAITPPPAAEVTLPEVEVAAEKPALTEPIEAQKVEVKEEPKEVVAEPLKDVESTAKALRDNEEKGGTPISTSLINDNTFNELNERGGLGINDIISEAYHKAKADGSNPELVKAVEDLLGKPTEAEAKPAEEVVAVEKPITETTYNFEKDKPENAAKFDYYTREEYGITKYFKKEKQVAEEAVTEGEKKKTTKVSDFLRKNLKTKPIVFKDKDGNEIILEKQGFDWDGMVDKVADLIDKGYEVALAVKEYLKSQDWFKSLNKDQQDAVIEQSVTNFETSIKEAEKGVKEFTKEVAKTIKDLSNNIDKLKQKVTDAKSRIESIKEQGKKIKEWINANRKELKGLTDAQFVNLSKKLTDANLQSDINKIIDYLNKSLSNADYNDKLSQAKKLNKDLKKLAKRPTTLVNESEALKRLASIPPSSSWDIDKLNEYNAFAQGLIDSVGEARNKKGTPDRTEKPITTEEIDSRYDKLKSDYDNDVFNKLVEDNEAYFMAQGKGLTPADLDKIKKDLAELNGDDLKKQEDALARLEQRKEFKEAMKQIVSEQVNKVLNLDRSQFTERQNSIIDGLKNIDLEKANTRSLIELNNVLNNIETNGDFSNAGRAIEAEARSQEANKESRSIAERFKLFKFKTDTFWNLVRTKRSFDAIMQRLTLKSADAQAKLNVALGDTDLSRSHVKVRKFVDSVNQTIDKYIKKNKPSVEDIHTLGTVYRLIQNSGIGDVDKQDQFNQIKEDFKASIENLKKGTEKEKALGELQQKIYDKLDLDNVNNQKELIDNFSKINPKGMEIINNLIKEYSKIEPLFRENQELYNNTTYTPLENYLPIQNKTLKSKQTTDLETSDDFSRNSMGINKSLSKSSIKRVGLNRSNQYMNTDFFNVVSKKAVDVANQAYTLADRVAIEKTINSDEFQETFGEDNASVLRDAYKAKVDHIMNIYPMQGDINKFAQVLNKISSAGAVRAIGGALQSIKQPVVLVNTAIQLAQNGNADLIGKALKIYSSKDEGFRKMLDSAPISLRETTKAGTAVSSEVDTVAESELKRGLTELYKKFNLAQEEIADKVLVFLKKGDTMPAEVSWAAYYMESLRKQGQDINQIDWDAESKNPNKEALAYAEAMVSNKQNVSDPANISKVIGSKDAWFQLGRSLLAPLSSYSFNTRNRLNDDFLALARGGDRKEATKDIIATAAEMYAYSVVAKTLYSLLLKPASDKLLEYFGFDPEKDPREWDEIIADIAKNKAKYGLLADFISTGTTVFGEEAGKRLANSVYKAFNDEEPKVGEYANMTSEQWQNYYKELRDYERTLPFREKPIPDILSGAGTIGIISGMGYNAYDALNYAFDDQNRFEQTQRLGENTLEGVKTGELVASSGRTKELTDKEKAFFVLSGIFGATSFVFPMLSELTSINRMAYGKARRQAERKYGVFDEGKLPTGFYTKYQELQDKRMKVSQDKSITSREQNEKLKEIDKELDRIEKQRAGGQEIKPKK